MNRRRLLHCLAPLLLEPLAGCRGRQFAQVLRDDQPDMVGSHEAGAETFNPLVEEAVAKLLARQQSPFQPVAFDQEPGAPPPRRTVCFIGVENQSAEELGDFKEQLYEQIDAQIMQSPQFQPISRWLVAAALREIRMRPDALMIPENMRLFAGILEQQSQPFDYLLLAKITSGTTQSNSSYQRDYVLTLELVNIQTGQYDKEAAKVRKGYHRSRLGQLRNYGLFSR